ncbi:MAG: hypothetical protein RLW68_01020 [Devosia marina]|uniref:hypothetical protein n=1 Tax=Devosia marina TaxID=2683198 RepID=UPI0032ECD11B
MKLTPSESKLIELIEAAGGSYCPGADVTAPPEVNRLVRRLERRGLLQVEMTDDGPRYGVVGNAN